jgi:Asp-tRNA(Asn)/Glu-tRNA(Gln) amidotransferase A subunit family amidase
VKGLVTTDGWIGYLLSGHELIAPADATVVAKLRASGAVIIGQTNMPDFAASDTTISTAGGRTGNAYDWHFSPGGSSGGTVTAVTANFAVFGTGTDTSNSIRMPSGTSAVVGVLPTRGLVSIGGIHPLDWLLDNTGPIARSVTDAAIALEVMIGEDPLDFRTQGSLHKAQPGPLTRYLKADSLKRKRFGVPAFIVKQAGESGQVRDANADIRLRPETRAVFMKAIQGLRAAGATVVFDDAILPDRFSDLADEVNTEPYLREGVDAFLRNFGPVSYHSAADYEKVVGMPLPAIIMGFGGGGGQRLLENDPDAEANFAAPQRKALAAYQETLDRFHLDGMVYPAIQMPPNNETIPQPDNQQSRGPHSNTAWVNKIGVPAVVVPGGFYANGLPFGLEFSARPWKDGDLLGWAYAFEQSTKYRRPPVLIKN